MKLRNSFTHLTHLCRKFDVEQPKLPEPTAYAALISTVTKRYPLLRMMAQTAGARPGKPEIVKQVAIYLNSVYRYNQTHTQPDTTQKEKQAA